LHKFPCRGQRRRSNAATAKKINFVNRFAPGKDTEVSKKNKVKKNGRK